MVLEEEELSGAVGGFPKTDGPHSFEDLLQRREIREPDPGLHAAYRDRVLKSQVASPRAYASFSFIFDSPHACLARQSAYVDS